VTPYYAARGQVIEIDGMQPIDDVTAAIEKALAAH